MNKRYLMIGALAAAMFGGTGLATANNAQNANTVNEIKSGALESRRERKYRLVNQMGGLDMVQVGGVFGMTPKQYGINFGTGISRKHSNRLRFSHNAKLKRRK